ncbi:restriction endonuclease subunit S [Thermococcus sp. LS2]|uniref:restriction endonuclease subunit S n=1 Tax=Thermococcus sp. LS2 TaxID=1638260 RepID=UPI00143C30E7|nr:restriction endonuclease subunit S [Thermococcus sp. LS2]NJE13785.1 restriction endonuclease subunit S [Thermococcus sp. LS2]
MQTKTKLKKTPIGEIPEDWEVVRLKDVAKEILTGATPLRSRREFWENGTIPWLTNEEVMDGKINYIYDTSEKITELALKKTNVKLIPPDSVILSLTASVGKVAINKIPITTNQQFNSFVLNKKKVFPEFLAYYFIFAKKRIELLGGTTTFKFISKSKISNFLLPLPPLPEQRKIAEILRTVDEAIEKTDLAIEKTERLKRGLMTRLLTRGIGHERFKKTELGEIPEEWRVVRLGDVASSFQYGLSTKLKDSGRYPVIKMDSILNGKVLPINLKYTDLDEITFRKYKLEKGDVLINRTNSYELVGRTGVFMLEGDYVFASYLIRLKPNLNVVDPMFLTLYLIFAGNRLRQLATRAVSQANINASNLKKFKIPLPPLSEQKQIAEILMTVDRKLELLRQRRERLERVKKGLMKDLLTGRRRVKT